MITRHLLRAIFFASLVAQTASPQAGAAAEPDAASFYKGRTLHLLIPSAPGGINDLASRLVAKHLGRFVAGEPRVVPENLPGQAGAILANRLYNTVEKDGLTLGFIDRAAPQLAIQGDPNAKFDPLKLTWLGSLSSYANDAYVLVITAKSPIKSVDDLRRDGASIQLSAMTPGTTNFIFAYIAKDIFNLNINVVRGYTGAAPMFLAMLRGEVDGQVVGFGAMKAGQGALWTQHEVTPLIQFGRATRAPELSNVPTGRELAPDEDARALVEFAELPFFMALPFAAPPNIPAERAAALQAAFMNMTRDPEYLADAEKISIDTSPIDGAAIKALLQRSADTPRQIIERYTRLLSQ